MKKFTFIIFFVIAMLQTQAQNYLISFEGSGETTVIDTIKVFNLTSGVTAVLKGGDILHLFPPVGIGNLDAVNGNLKMSPNPMTAESELTFFAPESGTVCICIADLSGKSVCQFNNILSPGEHRFRVSGINQGFYIVKVTGKNYYYSAKLISQNNLQNEPDIENVSFVKNGEENVLKSTRTTVDMPYTQFDLLLYKGISGKYTTLVTDIPSSSHTTTFKFFTCTDYDNNNYAIVQIFQQAWMAENLKVTHYLNSDEILNETDNTAWSDLSTGAYCWYNNDEATYKTTYGALYNWYAGNDSRKLCPSGWHMPSDGEWTTLTTFLGDLSEAGGKMKSTGTHEAGTGLWSDPNLGATNESGFSALPGGIRNDTGIFDLVGNASNWWSATQSSSNYAWYRHVSYNEASVSRGNLKKTFGYSVRCIRD